MSGALGGGGDYDARIQKIARVAKMMGKSVAGPMAQQFLRKQVVQLLSKHDPSTLEQYIHVDYPLVEKELPDGVKQALSNVGPQFEDEIQAHVRPDVVMNWLEHPEEWLDPEENPEAVADVRECYEIIENTPGGREWVKNLCIQIWDEAGVL